MVATRDEDGTVRVLDPRTGRPVHEALTAPGGNGPGVAFSRDGALLAITTSTTTIGTDDVGHTSHAARMWDLRAGRPIGPSLAGAKAMGFSPDGRLVATSEPVGVFRLREVRNGRPVGDPMPARNETGMATAAFSPDGRLLATSNLDRVVRLWEVPTGRSVGELSGHVNGILTVAFSADGRLVAAGGLDQTVWLWEPRTGRHVATLHPHRGQVSEVGFSPDGYLLVHTDDRAARWWDLRTEREIGAPMSVPASVAGLAELSSGSRLLATSEPDSPSARLWDPYLFRDPLASLCARVGDLSTERLRSYTADKPELAFCR
jgi:WD40 repeat protein